MQLSRVTLVSRIATASCRRFASTTKGTTNPPKSSAPPKPSATSSAAPQSVQPITQGPGTPRPKVASDEVGFDFKRAQMGLPKRLYSKSGVVASRLYALTEHKHPGNKKDEVDKVAEALVALRDELKAHPRAGKAFLTPRYSKEQKGEFINRFGKLLKLHPMVQALTTNLVKTNTAGLYNKVVADFLALKDARDDVVKVDVTLASKEQPQPKPETIRNLLSYGPKTQVQLSVHYDPTIEGGAIIRAPEKFVDLSFKRDLRILREKLDRQATVERSAKRRLFDEQLAAIHAWNPSKEEVEKLTQEAKANLGITN
jgi:F0F1-type ATP synthase delta subunit